MASIDTLPADQRAVLQLVLQRGRSYDEIAQMLSIDSAAVRERALSALQALGPGTRISDDGRREISDYLLGQLPSEPAERVRERIAQAPAERAWARVVASELALLANGPLPEIPVDASGQAPAEKAEADAAGPTAAGPVEPRWEVLSSEPLASSEPQAAPVSEGPTSTGTEPREPRRSSRTGGAVLLAAGALVALAVVVVAIVLVPGGGDSTKHSASTSTGAAASASTTTSTSASATARPIAQVNLVSPTHSKKVAGVAEIVKQGTKTGLVIVAQGMPANTSHDAYAVWLYNSQSDNHILGFVNPGVKTNGKLQTAGALPTNASHFKQLLVTLETQAKPHGPGKIVLKGTLSITQ